MVLALNKVDKVKDKSRCCRVLERLGKNGPTCARMVPISARKGTNVDRLVGELWSLLPGGPPLSAPRC